MRLSALSFACDLDCFEIVDSAATKFQAKWLNKDIKPSLIQRINRLSLSKRQLPRTVLLRTPVTQMIIFNQGLSLTLQYIVTYALALISH